MGMIGMFCFTVSLLIVCGKRTSKSYPKGIKWLAVELRHVLYFIAVAECLNFSKAALQLHIAQPPPQPPNSTTGRGPQCYALSAQQKGRGLDEGRPGLSRRSEKTCGAGRTCDGNGSPRSSRRMRQHQDWHPFPPGRCAQRGHSGGLQALPCPGCVAQ